MKNLQLSHQYLDYIYIYLKTFRTDVTYIYIYVYDGVLKISRRQRRVDPPTKM